MRRLSLSVYSPIHMAFNILCVIFATVYNNIASQFYFDTIVVGYNVLLLIYVASLNYQYRTTTDTNLLLTLVADGYGMPFSALVKTFIYLYHLIVVAIFIKYQWYFGALVWILYSTSIVNLHTRIDKVLTPANVKNAQLSLKITQRLTQAIKEDKSLEDIIKAVHGDDEELMKKIRKDLEDDN